MRKLLKSLACFATAALVGASAFANYDWYDTSIGIGGIKSNFQEWSRGNGAPDTDLGALTSLTLSSVEMNIWDDDNDRGGVNMFFRLYGDNGQIGGDVDVWLGSAERIEGSVHDFSVSYTGPFDLANAFGVTLEDGKTYYLNMWAKSYGPAGDHWFNGDGDNYHTKFVYCGTPKTYTLVESADDLVVGADYLVVSTVDGAYSAMKNEVNGTGLGCLGLADDAISGNIISAASDAIVWQIVSGTALGQRELYNAAANVFAADSDDLAGRAQLLADGTDALAQWTIDTSALPAVKFYSVSYPDRCLQRDNFAANERFAAYDRAHVAPCLYRDDSTEIQTVTFDPNGGTYPADKQTMKYVVGREYWGIHKPTLEGHEFLGWYDAQGNRIANFTEVTGESSRAMTARWGRGNQAVTLDPGEGSCATTSLTCSGTYKGIPKPTWEGHVFLGWFDADGTRAQNGMPVTDEAERTLTALWGGIQTVTFDAGEGSCSKTSLTCSGTYTGIPKATWAGHEFLGWYDAQGTRVQNGMTVTDEANRALTALWGGTQTVTLDPGEGTCPKTTVTCSGTYKGLPKATLDGYEFRGWFDEDAGIRVMNGMPVTGGSELTLCARWLEIAPAAAASALSRAPSAKAGVRAASTVTDTITAGILAATSTTYTEFSGVDKTKDGINSDAVYAGKNSKNSNGAMQLRISDNSSGIVTTGSGGAAKSVTVVWQTTPGSDSGLYVYGKTSSYSAATDLYDSTKQGTLLGTITSGTAFEITGDYTYIGLKSKKGTIYPSSIAIEWTVASSDQSVTLNPAGPIEAEVGDEVIITATADGFSGDVTWSWTGSGTPDGNRFTVDTTSAFEAATVTATATYGTDETASQSVTVTVTAPKHAITIDSTIQNGTVTTDPEDEAAEGATVTVNASPDSGYKLGSITVNGSEITGTTFEMPAEDVTVSATFVEKTGGTVTYTVESKTEVSASGDVPDGSSAAYSQTYGTAKQATAGNSFTLTLSGYEGLKIVGLTLSMRSNGSSGAGNLSVTCGDATIASIETAAFSDATWNGEYSTSYVDVTPSVTATTVDDDVVIQIAATVNSLYCQSYTVEYETVPVVVEPTVTVTASATEVFVNTEVTITATAENFDAPASDLVWEWKVGTTVDPTQEGTTFTWTPSDAGTYTVTATATDGDNIDDDSVTITVNALPEPHDVVVMTDGNGTAEADIDKALPGTTITVTATPNADCRLDAITVNDEPITGTTFEMPNEDVLVYVTFEAKHDIEVFAGEHGQASADMDKAYAGETVTLTVTPDAGYAKDTIKVNDEVISGTSFEMPAEDALVEVTFKEVVIYTLVESADDFVVGADYVIVASGNGFTEALKNAANGNRIGTEAVTVSDDGKTIENPSADVIWQVVSGTALGQRELFNAAANVFAAAPGTAGNNAQLLADGTDDLAQWTIDLSALPEVKICSVSYDGRYLQRNNTAGNHYFATYSSSQATPSLYRADSTVLQTVTFDANGGEYPADKATMKYVVGREYWGIWKPTFDGHEFLGWYDEQGNRVVNYTPVTEETSRALTARWGGASQTVTLDAKGGTCTPESLTCSGTYKGLPKPTKDGYEFLGWFDDEEAGTRIQNGMAVSDAATLTLYARWGAAAQTVTLDPQGGTCSKTSLTCSGTYKGLPKPTKDGCEFLGWFDDEEAGTRIQNGMAVSDAATLTLYARWGVGAQTVTLDANGGQCSKTTLACSGTYKGLPKATLDNHEFAGWFDEDTGGRVMNGMPVAGGSERTLVAHWKELVISGLSMKKSAGIAARGNRETADGVLTFDAVAGSVYEVLWTPALGGEWTVLKTVNAEEDGAMAVSVELPADSVTGFFRLRVIAAD